MNSEAITGLLQDLINEGEGVIATKRDVSEPSFVVGPLVDVDIFSDWTAKVLAVLERFPKGTVDSQIERINECSQQKLDVCATVIQPHLKSVLLLVQQDLLNAGADDVAWSVTGLKKDELICRRFHRVCLSLRQRRSGREPPLMEDEYDKQYLFEALLNLYFDNICPEEWTPRYADKSSRIDFLLPE